MASSIYKLRGKLFRYDEKSCIVHHIMKATEEDLKDEAEWMEKYGHPLYGIDADGYIELSGAGLRPENWKNRESRDEYLNGWIDEMEEEAAIMAADFVKYELPLYQNK